MQLSGKKKKSLIKVLKGHYGERLVSVLIYGSYGRGKATPESDLDLLLVINGLPPSRAERVEEFISKVEDKLEGEGLPYLSVVLKTPGEACRGSPLFLDMVEDAEILYDKEGFFQGILDRLRARLKELGAKRIFKGTRWYWVLKPDLKPGEVFEI